MQGNLTAPGLVLVPLDCVTMIGQGERSDTKLSRCRMERSVRELMPTISTVMVLLWVFPSTLRKAPPHRSTDTTWKVLSLQIWQIGVSSARLGQLQVEFE